MEDLLTAADYTLADKPAGHEGSMRRQWAASIMKRDDIYMVDSEPT
jgi:hypothetical protein